MYICHITRTNHVCNSTCRFVCMYITKKWDIYTQKMGHIYISHIHTCSPAKATAKAIIRQLSNAFLIEYTGTYICISLENSNSIFLLLLAYVWSRIWYLAHMIYISILYKWVWSTHIAYFKYAIHYTHMRTVVKKGIVYLYPLQSK